MTTPDLTVEAALERVKQLDRAGDLDGAKEEVERLRLELQPTATVQIRSRLLRVGARVLRHRHERASLRNAGNAAGSALAISQAAPTPNGTAVTLASLEVAACELASGDVDAAIRRVEGVRDHPDPAISGWAHLIVGRSRLAQGRHFPAIASMHNAIAEFQRHGHAHRTAAARLWLAVALDDAGRVEEAHRVLTEDRAVWTGDAPVRRVSILHRLTSAANARSRGEIGESLRLLAEARDLLDSTTGMRVERARMHRLRAECYWEWGQFGRADAELAAAHKAQPVDQPSPRARTRVQEPPLPPAPLALAASDAPAGTQPSQRLDDEVLEALDRLTEDQVRGSRGVRFVVGQCERLQGVSGYERDEVFALFRAARRLDPADAEALHWRERLLRRAEARLEFLPGLETLRGRVRVQLAGLLADGDRSREALSLIVQALLVLDGERFAMATRDWRATWLAVEIEPAYDLAIRLTVALGETSLARDLIVRSRAAGVVSPGTELPHRRPTLGDVPLVPPPRFRFLDGEVSSLGEGAPCLFC